VAGWRRSSADVCCDVWLAYADVWFVAGWRRSSTTPHAYRLLRPL
jgi:hypothetical protein